MITQACSLPDSIISNTASAVQRPCERSTAGWRKDSIRFQCRATSSNGTAMQTIVLELVSMAIPSELLPVVQVTLPILLGMFYAVHSQNKRLDDIVARLTAIENRLLSIEKTLASHGERITRLEERIPPLVHHN